VTKTKDAGTINRNITDANIHTQGEASLTTNMAQAEPLAVGKSRNARHYWVLMRNILQPD
jgi:hypothetical protein